MWCGKGHHYAGVRGFCNIDILSTSMPGPFSAGSRLGMLVLAALYRECN